MVILTGPTAVGKTALSFALAKKINGAIISADSMQVYKYMDIGSAKPTKEELAQMPHHLVDLIDPRDDFSVAQYQKLAKDAIARPVGQRNPDPLIAEMEEELEEAINATGRGPMGLGGDVSCLAVHIECAYTHITQNPVAVNTQCWPARRARAIITPSGNVAYGY